MSYVILGCRLLLLGIFLASLAGKVRSRQAFREFVAATATLLAVPSAPARRFALLAMAAEAAIVVLLAVPPTVPAVAPPTLPAGFALAAVTLAGFGYALARALRQGRTAPCRCFGASSAPVGRRHVIRNLVLIAAAATAAVAALGGAPQAVETPGVVITALAALVCVVLVTRLDDIAELFRPTVTGR
ncbi:MauE/DoxX family redox-associated membrane protein [Streptosporangium sp. NPDC023615]|uniref:MauE/DoxX family redox-associated membrane protein n=1 Tax=Streptosporangium sp. NPDC023615 TaxID=3154794 RepID=UPI003429E392